MINKKYLPDFIFGGIDGLVTTFAVVSSVVGASLSTTIILILGFANLFADGFSMAVSNYISSKSEEDLEHNHVNKHAYTSALVTFLSFIVVGLVPLLAFVFDFGANSFTIATILTGIAFFCVGYFKGFVTGKNRFMSALQTFLIGALAALIAYVVGFFLAKLGVA